MSHITTSCVNIVKIKGPTEKKSCLMSTLSEKAIQYVTCKTVKSLSEDF